MTRALALAGPVTVTILAADRFWVSEALLDCAIALEDEEKKRRKPNSYTKMQLERARRLRRLADKVRE